MKEGRTQLFEFINEKSKKFWLIDFRGRSLSFRFGKGEASSKGQYRSKSFADEISASNEADRLIMVKIEEGYKEIEWFGWDKFFGRDKPREPVKIDPKIIDAQKKYWKNYQPLLLEWIKLIEDAKEDAFEKYKTRKLYVDIETKQNRLVFYAKIPAEKKRELLYKRDGGPLMKEQIDLLKMFCVDYPVVHDHWLEDLECIHAEIWTDLDEY
jgi:predicted DNA-binding WGR domain protein